jgi:hypothetical protein
MATDSAPPSTSRCCHVGGCTPPSTNAPRTKPSSTIAPVQPLPDQQLGNWRVFWIRLKFRPAYAAGKPSCECEVIAALALYAQLNPSPPRGDDEAFTA